jgi:hypothetical protein
MEEGALLDFLVCESVRSAGEGLGRGLLFEMRGSLEGWVDVCMGRSSEGSFAIVTISIEFRRGGEVWQKQS